MRFRQKVFCIFWKTELLKEKKIKRQIPKTFSFEMQNSKSWSNNFLKHLQLLFPLVLEGHKKTEKLMNKFCRHSYVNTSKVFGCTQVCLPREGYQRLS